MKRIGACLIVLFFLPIQVSASGTLVQTLSCEKSDFLKYAEDGAGSIDLKTGIVVVSQDGGTAWHVQIRYELANGFLEPGHYYTVEPAITSNSASNGSHLTPRFQFRESSGEYRAYDSFDAACDGDVSFILNPEFSESMNGNNASFVIQFGAAGAGVYQLPSAMTIKKYRIDEENLPPVAVINPTAITVDEGDVVNLSHSLSYDPEGGDITHAWTIINGPEVELNMLATGVEFMSPEVLEDTTIFFQLTVKDDFQQEDSTVAMVMVHDINGQGEPPDPGDCIPGDANGDGKVDIADTIYTLQIVSGKR